jgi:hypothetical protein
MKEDITIKGGALDHNLRCAANLEYIEGSCLNIDELKALAITYNNAIKSKKIKGVEIKLINNKEVMINELDNRFKSCKGKQLCWLKQNFIAATKDFDPEDFFRPYGTDNKRDWLSDLNINQVMNQMEKKFEDFLFIGAVPIDFYEIDYQNIAKINFNEIMKDGYKEKNHMMFEYNLKLFYYKNILLIQEISKFNKKNNKTPFYDIFNFLKDMKKTFDNDLLDLMNKFNNQFNDNNYDPVFVKMIRSQYKNLPQDFTNEIIKMKNKKYPITKIACVPNLDTHDKGGSHWVAFFADLVDGRIYFYDSYGVRPVKRIREYIKKIAEWKYKEDTGKTLNIDANDYMKKNNNNEDIPNELEKKYDIRYSQIRNQFKNSECGVYSMNFIIRLLHKTKFDDIIGKAVPDDTINKCREVYFENQNINDENFTIEDDGKKLKIKKTNGYICE